MKKSSAEIIANVKKNIPNKILNYFMGEFVDTSNGDSVPVFCPLNHQEIGQVVLSRQKDLEEFMPEIKRAQSQWAQLTLKKRSEVIYKYRELLIENINLISQVIHVENGKCINDAKAEILKAIETVEYSCSISNDIDSRLQEVSNGVYAFNEYKPIGVTACITPFNFPVMVPHWTIAQTIVLGNAVILKPSEQTPITSQIIAKLWKSAGLPNGIFNIFNGSKNAVEALCYNESIKAISFVGSTTIAKKVYDCSKQNNKRILALGGAKNFILISENVDSKKIIKDLISSAFGMTGQRCMAASVIITVGENKILIDELIKELKKMKIGPNLDFNEGLGPVANKDLIKKILNYLSYAKENGAKILVDGETFKVEDKNFSEGYFIGPSLIDWTNNVEAMKDEEVFGPVLEVIQAKDWEHAIQIQNNSSYGNAASIFTSKGWEAFSMKKQLQAGMIGINIGVPVPREPFSFGGIKLSKFGYGDITGPSANMFWSDLIKTTLKWDIVDKKDWIS